MKNIYSIILVLIGLLNVFLSCETTHGEKTQLATDTQENLDSLNSDVNLSILSFQNNVYDFGDVWGDTILTAKYHLINQGKYDLLILKVEPDCFCTKHTLSKSRISPKDSAVILLEFNTKNKYGEQKIYSTVTANTQDKLYRLVLKANIKRK